MTSTMIRRDPFFADFDNLVQAALGSPTGNDFAPAVETRREGDDAVIRLEVPGVDVTKDVNVEVQGRDLVISGERRDERREETEGRRFSEFRYGSFTRSFQLPANVTADDVSASYDAGVLTVRVAGAYTEAEGHKIQIGSGASERGEDAEEQSRES
jgi:HSP20 family protein